MNDHERYEEWDAAYLLGALSPAERREYENHLAECERCSADVGDLAAMPALLGALPADDALRLVEQTQDATRSASPVPPRPAADLLPQLLRRVHRRRITRRWIVGGVGALAAAAVAAALLLPGALAGGGSLTPGEATTTIALQHAEAVPLSASVDLTAVPWGTRVTMTCRYEATGSPAYTHRYALYVIARDGDALPVSTWNASPGQTVHTTGSMALAVSDVARVEVRDALTQEVLLSHAAG